MRSSRAILVLVGYAAGALVASFGQVLCIKSDGSTEITLAGYCCQSCGCSTRPRGDCPGDDDEANRTTTRRHEGCCLDVPVPGPYQQQSPGHRTSPPDTTTPCVVALCSSSALGNNAPVTRLFDWDTGPPTHMSTVVLRI